MLGDVAIWQLAVILVAAVVGNSLSGVAGFGGGVLVLPVLVWVYGPAVAVPVVAIFQVIGTATRVWINREHMNWKVAGWFAAGSTPFAILGSFIFINANTDLLVRVMGGAMIALVTLTQLPWAQRVRMTLWGFAPLGAVSGFLAAIVGVPGPFQPVFYMAYGLRPLEYMATFSLGMFLIQVPKLAVYGSGGLLTPLPVVMGLCLGVIAVAGAVYGAKILRRLPDKVYKVGLNLIIVGFGVLFLVTGG